jgi:hypothetical protein
MNCQPRFCRPVETFSPRHAVGDQRRAPQADAWTARCLRFPLRERHRRKAGYGKLTAAVALVELPARTPTPGALCCSQVHSLGLSNRDEERLIDDGGKHVSVGDTVPFPGTWQGQTGKTPPAAAVSCGALGSTPRTSWCAPPRTGRCPRSRPAVVPVASQRVKATTPKAQLGCIEVIRGGSSSLRPG